MSTHVSNVDPEERDRFDELAASWWDPEGESKPLHELNPSRLRFIAERARLEDARTLDVGCGGGILSEALASQGAEVTGIDIADRALQVARLHLRESGQSVQYENATVEAYAEAHAAQFQIVTCMELIEHVPDPVSVVRACARLLEPGGHCFFSTLNRSPAAFALAIVGAEHVLRLVPRGTHRYDRFIKPSELAGWMRGAGLEVREITGLQYNPFSHTAKIGGAPLVNYLVHARMPEKAR